MGVRRMPEPLLAVRDLHAWYGESHILHGVDFDVRAGRGGDAARPQRRRQDDDAQVDHGHRAPAHRLGALRRRRADRAGPPTPSPGCGIAFCPEERGIFASLNVEENLLLPPRVRAGRARRRGAIFELFPNLKERLRSQGTKLSGGEQQMLAIGRILRTGAAPAPARRADRGAGPGHRRSRSARTIAPPQGARASRSCSSSRTSASPPPWPTATTSMEHGRVVDLIPNADLAASMDKLHEYLGV